MVSGFTHRTPEEENTCLLYTSDYFNNLTTGNVMRPVADGHHISRAKLSYMCDATAAPVCIMMPVSSLSLIHISMCIRDRS